MTEKLNTDAAKVLFETEMRKHGMFESGSSAMAADPETGGYADADTAAMWAGFKIAFETLTKKTEDALVWRNTGSPNGLRRFMTKKQYDAQTPGVQKWYEPIRYDVPEGWQLVPVEPTEEILRAIRSMVLVESCYRAMLAAAHKPEGAA